MNTISKIFFTVIFLSFLTSCWKQDYDHQEKHNQLIEHKYEEDEKNFEKEDFKEIVQELESKDRIIWQKPEKVMEMLGSLKGKTVADIGAGTGYFSFRLAHEADKVIAVEIDSRFIHYIDSIKTRFPEVIQQRIETRLADTDDPKLNPSEVDAVILVNTYCYIENRIDYFSKLRKSMKPGAQLLIVDYKKKKLPEGNGPPVELRVAVDSVETELENAGYRLMETDDTTLDYQYIVLVTNP